MSLLSYIKIKTLTSMASHAEYRFSLVTLLFINAVFGFTSIFITYSIYSITEKGVMGWTFYEITFLVGIYMLLKGIYHLFFSFEDMTYDIRRGEFDKMIVQPLNIIIQYYNFNLYALSDLIAATVMFAVSIPNINLNISIMSVLFFIFLLMNGFMSLFSIYLLSASTSFFITNNHSIIANIDMIRSRFAVWPATIYSRNLQLIFTILFPISVVGFVPASFILGKDIPLFFWYSPIAVIIFTIISISFFKYGLRKYSSTGS